MKSGLFLFFLAVSAAFAQETVNFGSISGRVTDPSGAPIESATVTTRHGDTNLKCVVTSDNEGRFRVPYLKVGVYHLTVQKPGFATFVQSIEVGAGAAFELPIGMQLRTSETTVTVSGETAVLEAARSQIAGAVSQTEVRDVPLNGRNFLDLALLVPGVSGTNTGSNQLFAETSAVPGQGISVGSQRNFSNNFIVDGLSANDDNAGLSGVFYGLDVVSEFQVVTSGGQAELGRALGGYVNVVTKSGTNTLHGDLYNYFRNQRFNAANPLSNSTLPSTQMQSGASLGGPIVHDRTFYFGNFERRQLEQSGLITIAPANVAAINARLAAVRYPGSPIATGLYSAPVHNETYLAKVDHQFAAGDLFGLRYSAYHVDSSNSRGAGGLSAATASAGLRNLDQTVAFSNIATLSSRTVNETRGQFTHSNLEALPTDPVGPSVSLAGVATFGTLSGSPTARRNDLYEIVNNLSHQSGAHALRLGADFLYNDSTITYPRSIRGNYSFSSLSNFLQGVYNNSGFTQTFGNTVVSQTNPNLGIYAQDEWKASPRLTLNVGVRYDLQWLQTIATDSNNFAPRAGFAWTPFASRKTVVRGSFGLFYDRIPLRALANALLSSGNTTTITESSQLSVSLSPAQTGAPVFPNILPGNALPAGVLVNFSTMNREMQNAYSEQASFEIEHQFGTSATLSVGYQYLRGLHLIASINRNAPTCAASGINNGCRPDPTFANNSQYSSIADSNSNGLNVSFVKRPTRWGSYRVSYNWSKALDNVGEFFFSSPIDNANIWRDYGRSDDDQRHRLVFDGTIHTSMTAGHSLWERLNHGFQLSGILQYTSALPLNLVSGVNTIQGTAGRPIVNGDFIGRNIGTGNDFFGVNARLMRVFGIGERLHIEAMAEAFNLLNHRNNLTLNNNFGSAAYPLNPAPSFRQVTAVNDPRSMQFALRFRF